MRTRAAVAFSRLCVLSNVPEGGHSWYRSTQLAGVHKARTSIHGKGSTVMEKFRMQDHTVCQIHGDRGWGLRGLRTACEGRRKVATCEQSDSRAEDSGLMIEE